MCKIFFKTSRVVKVEFHGKEKNQQWVWVKSTGEKGQDLSGFYWGGTTLMNGVMNEGKPFSLEEIEDKGFIVDNDFVVYNLPEVKVFLEHGETVTRRFYDPEEAENWAQNLMTDSGYTRIISFHD